MADGLGSISVDPRTIQPPGEQSAGSIGSASSSSSSIYVDPRTIQAPGPQGLSSIANALSVLSSVYVDPRTYLPPGERSLGYIDTSRALWIPEIQLSGRRILVLTSTNVEVPAGTWYLGGGGLKTSEAEAAAPVKAGTLLGVFVGSSVDPDPGSVVVTARKGTGAAPTSLGDTANVVTLSAGEQKDKDETNVAFSDQNWFCLKIVSAGGAPNTVLNITLDYDFAS